MFPLRLLPFLFLLVTAPAFAQDDLNHQLQHQYVKRVLILRNFYPGRRLSYDSDGRLVASARPGDWSGDGIVEIKKIRLYKNKLQIQANRLIVFARSPNELSLIRPDDPLELDVDFGTQMATLALVSKIWSAIFLNSEDRIVELVPDFWKTCLKVGLTTVDNDLYSGCRLSKNLANLLGAGSFSKDDPAMRVADRSTVFAQMVPGQQDKLYRVGSDVTPPKQLQHREPEFSECARKFHLQGTLLLSLIVDKTGTPRDIRVARPLGCDLDANAVQTVEMWKFKPAEKNGEPVPVEIAVEVSFQLQ